MIRYQARLVGRGFLQGHVSETFAPVVDFSAVLVCIRVAVQRGYAIHQVDVRTAFLHGQIDDDVFVTAPDGLSLPEEHEVLKLRKGLSGSKRRRV